MPRARHSATTRAPERSDISSVGGFSDTVFRVVVAFLGDDCNRFVGEVESIESSVAMSLQSLDPF